MYRQVLLVPRASEPLTRIQALVLPKPASLDAFRRFLADSFPAAHTNMATNDGTNDIVRSPPRPPKDTQYLIVLSLDYYIYIQYLLLALVVLKKILKSGPATACLALNWPPRRRKQCPKG